LHWFYCFVQDSQVDTADLFDDADDRMLLDAADESDGGGSIPGIDTDVDDDDEDAVSTADSVQRATADAAQLVPGMHQWFFSEK